MAWQEGTIVEFPGGKPQHRDVRKIRTRPEQDWPDFHFFHISLARDAGYPDAELAAGRRIEFEPDPKADSPRVLSFKPYIGSARPAPARAVPARSFLNPYHFVPLEPPSHLAEPTRS